MPIDLEPIIGDFNLYLSQTRGQNIEPGYEVRPFHYETVSHFVFWKKHIKYYFAFGDEISKKKIIVKEFLSHEELFHQAFLDRLAGYIVVEHNS